MLASLKLVPKLLIFITSRHVLSLLITPYFLDWKENHFMLTNLKLVPRLQIFYHILSCLVTPRHILSPGLLRKPFYIGNFKISSQALDFLSHLITSCQLLSHLIPPYHLVWKENHFMLATLKLFPRLLIFIPSYHVLLFLITPYLLGWKENHFMLVTLKLGPRI